MDSPPFAYRILRRGLKLASRAAGDAVDRAMQRSREPEERQPRRRTRTAVSTVSIRFEGAGRGVEGQVGRGLTVLDAAEELDVDLAHYCGGNCSCGTCRVVVVEGATNLSRQRPEERMVLGASHQAEGHRLACQAAVNGPVVIRVPDWF